MAKSISQVNDAPQITDFFRNQDVSHFCQCGKILPKGAIACMPDNTAEPMVITIRGAVGQWTPVMIDPRSGRIMSQGRTVDTPCQALTIAARMSAQSESQIRADLFDGEFDWSILIKKVSRQLVEEGVEMARKWQVLWASGDKRSPATSSMHPLKVDAYESEMGGPDSLVWDVATFNAHAVEVA